MFLLAVSLLHKLVVFPGHALLVASSLPHALKQWESIEQIIGRKMDMERKYIARLEGKVGERPGGDDLRP